MKPSRRNIARQEKLQERTIIGPRSKYADKQARYAREMAERKPGRDQ